MSYRYNHFIQQNIAPPGAKGILVCDAEGNKVTSILLGGLTPPKGQPLYSFGLVSDIHLWETDTPAYGNSNSKFDTALSYFKEQHCSFCVVCGDLTLTGLYLRTNENVVGTEVLNEGQFLAYKTICAKHPEIPVYELAGNHESYYEQPITQNMDKWKTYTGKNVLSYTVTQGDDLFILLGQPRDRSVMSDEDFLWLEQTLEANRDKRCFVFVHSYIEEDSGDPGDYRENSIFDDYPFWGFENRTAFINLLKQYPNVILFHGHSHMKFECQAEDRDANYTEKNGFKSVHIPSLGRPRSIDPTASNPTPYADDEAQCYIVDVYEDCIVLNGLVFIIKNQILIPIPIPVPLGVFKIET